MTGLRNKSVSVIGLGKLGSCMAVCFANAGFNVIGVDINKEIVEKINKGIAPFQEPLLQDYLKDNKARIKATTDISEAMEKTDVSFLIVPTPSKEDGSFSNEYLGKVLETMAPYLKKKKYHLFVITSTVIPKDIEGYLIPVIETFSGKRLNKDFGVCYSPEFIALGRVISDFLNPDFILIGESDKKAGDILEDIYKEVCPYIPHCLSNPIKRMSIISAEIAKISLNSYVTMKISFANNLMNICQKIPDANIDDITNAIGCDKRISPHYLKGGLAYGGPCFPRDNRAFIKFASDHASSASLAYETDLINQKQHRKLADFILENTKDTDKICILGLSYKPDTPVVEESPSIELDICLSNCERNALTYDISDSEVFFKYCNVFIFMINDDKYWKILKYIKPDKKITIIDPWRRMIKKKWGKNIKYLPYGIKCG